jgi:hypothetical protein
MPSYEVKGVGGVEDKNCMAWLWLKLRAYSWPCKMLVALRRRLMLILLLSFLLSLPCC